MNMVFYSMTLHTMAVRPWLSGLQVFILETDHLCTHQDILWVEVINRHECAS